MESNNDDDIFHEKGHSMVYSLPAVCAEEYRFLEQAWMYPGFLKEEFIKA